LPVPFCLSSSVCPVWLSCSAFPLLSVLYCLSFAACPVLPLPLCLSFSSRYLLPALSACPVLPVAFCLSCSAGPFCLSCFSSCPVLPALNYLYIYTRISHSREKLGVWERESATAEEQNLRPKKERKSVRAKCPPWRARAQNPQKSAFSSSAWYRRLLDPNISLIYGDNMST
jgi:hypothetical protein